MIERGKGTNPDVIARVEEMAMTNHRMSYFEILQAIKAVFLLPSIPSTTIRRIRRTLRFAYLPNDDDECSTRLACRIAGIESSLRTYEPF
jgi:hypothetical protein